MVEVQLFTPVFEQAQKHIVLQQACLYFARNTMKKQAEWLQAIS
jgi:hypothetical protein